MRQQGIRNAQQCARALSYRFGVLAPRHIRVESFAERLGVEIYETRLDGANAQLVRNARGAVILVSDRVADPAARRFDIAHELGHFVLGHPTKSASELCVPYLSTRGVESARDYEAEASAFAAELLMPEALVRGLCVVSPVNLTVPRQIALEYNVSILAASIRFTELASERCAAVFSIAGTTVGKVKWFAPSAKFPAEIERGRALYPGSMAKRYFITGALDDRPVPVPAAGWLDTDRDCWIVEHSTAAPEFHTVLSMLWVLEDIALGLGMSR